jgi:pyruvate dehydrogenase E1 component
MLADGVAGSNGDLDLNDADTTETREWLDSLEAVLQLSGRDRVRYLLSQLESRAMQSGVPAPFTPTTPYINTIPADQEPEMPGDQAIERRIKSIVRWNALAMVVLANEKDKTIGGHIATFASSAALYEVGFNHFFRGPEAPGGADQVYFQGHASPGVYARGWLEGRLSEEQLLNFRRELAEGGGLSSYPHPWLMKDFWQFPTVSMGLGPIMAIYQARFNRYLESRGLKPASEQRIWCFLGDGEMDEPESLGAITVAAREGLDNLIFVVNCNLQRLDGPVRGNGKIIQELEGIFRGAGWNVIKVIWGSDWDPLLAADTSGALVQRMNEVVDGEFQKYSVESGKYIREKFFNSPELRALVEHLTDEQLTKLKRGGHDPRKIYAAFRAAVEYRGGPTVILAHTVKGYGLGPAAEGLNSVHQIKTFKEKKAVLESFRGRFALGLSDDDVAHARFFRPASDSPELRYLRERRRALGGSLPVRSTKPVWLGQPIPELATDFLAGSEGAAVSTTRIFVDILTKLMSDREGLGKYIVPIIPDEGRTFGMDPLFPKFKIYSSVGQNYVPVDDTKLTPYREDKKGQILQEGITEAGSMASFIAAGTSYATHGIPTVPFYIFYSMFGFQRIGDLIWAAADSRARGFLLGATAGRTTLNGEGLQHEDGHSPLLASTVPNVAVYDPAFGYEVAHILRDGMQRMYEKNEDVIYYLTLYNEDYAMPAQPAGVTPEAILKGMYRFRRAPAVKNVRGKAHLLGSGPILNYALRAQEILAEQFRVEADVWSVTSYKELRRAALASERWNLLHPAEPPRTSYVEELLGGEEGVFVAASDYLRAVPEMIDRWVPGGLFPLGTDGFGRSESRAALRRHFEIDAECITLAALYRLSRTGAIRPAEVQQAITKLGINPEKLDPLRA